MSEIKRRPFSSIHLREGIYMLTRDTGLNRLLFRLSRVVYFPAL